VIDKMKQLSRVFWSRLKLRRKSFRFSIVSSPSSRHKRFIMTFRSVNLNPPRAPRGGGGGRNTSGGSSYRGGNSGYNTPPLRIDASGRVDQGFGPVGGATAADPDFDIFGIDDMSTLQPQQQNVPNQQFSNILYVPLPQLV
jgi:hypothetical protein